MIRRATGEAATATTAIFRNHRDNNARFIYRRKGNKQAVIPVTFAHRLLVIDRVLRDTDYL